MFHISRPLALFLLIITTTIGCQEQPPMHPAEGKWRGSMISQGVVIDIGTVTIGANYLSLPESKVYYGHLKVKEESNNLNFSDPKDPSFNARVHMIDPQSASLEIEGINGYFDLTKES